MEFSTFTAGKDDEERRLDRVIKRLVSSENTQIFKALRKGLIKLNGKKADANAKVMQGDEIKIASFLLIDKVTDKTDEVISDNKQNNNIEEAKQFIDKHTILKTDDFLILNKPYDISVQGGSKNLSDIVSAVYGENNKKSSLSFKTGPLHRLDRKTTGLQVFSQSLEGAKWFTNAIKTHEIKKTYIAIAQGKLERSEKWIDFIDESEDIDKTDKKSFHTVKIVKTPNAKEAITTAIPLAYGKYRGKDVTLIEYKIETGRKHQIRAQSSFHGFTLLGDTAYGGERIEENQSHYLHAYRLQIQKNNPFGLCEQIDAFIMTNFEKMLAKLLIKWDNINII